MKRSCKVSGDIFSSVPVDILSYILQYIPLETVIKLEQCNKNLLEYCRREYLPMLEHFCIKQQSGNCKSFCYMMRHAMTIKNLFMDCQSIAFERSDSLICSRTLCSSSAFNSLQTLVIRSCNLFSNASLLRMIRYCSNLTTLGDSIIFNIHVYIK